MKSMKQDCLGVKLKADEAQDLFLSFGFTIGLDGSELTPASVCKFDAGNLEVSSTPTNEFPEWQLYLMAHPIMGFFGG